MTIQVTVSSELTELIDQWAHNYATNEQLVQDIIATAEREGITKKQMRELIEVALEKQGLGERSIRSLLPKDLKDQNKVRVLRQNTSAKSDTQRESNAQGGGGGGIIKPPEPAITSEQQKIFSEQHQQITQLELENSRLKEKLEAEQATAKYESEKMTKDLERAYDVVSKIAENPRASLKTALDLRKWGPSLMKALDDQMPQAFLYIQAGQIIDIKEF